MTLGVQMSRQGCLTMRQAIMEAWRQFSEWYQRLLDAGMEENGIKPVPIEKRTNTRYNNLFTVFFTGLLCILPLPTGMLATLVFGMSLRDASLTILFFSLLCCIPPAFMGCGGYLTGLRQLIQARYSWGFYLVTVPLLLNAATITGFTLIASIVGGQTIAAINPGNVSVSVGITITILISFIVSLLGFRALHSWERWSWIPNLLAIVVAVGCGGKHLYQQAKVEPATAPQIVSYGGLIAGYFLTFGGTTSDYSVYYRPDAPKMKIFTYIYLGLLTPSVPLLILGAAMGGAVPVVEGWADGYDTYGAGGVLAVMLEPAGGFGKFILVLLALTVLGNIAISMYSVALNLQMVLPVFTKIPRYLFIVVVIVVMIPVAIKAAEDWEESLENFLALIGYWAGCFDAVFIEELVVFRRMDFSTYDHDIWNVGRKLPSGVPALAASLLSMGLVVPGMAEAWYTGPIAKTTGDIGFEMAFFVTAILYFPFRWLEIRWRGHL
ncbi:permease for cytosine/purines, uracil, thiamine, allantoin-domain-containing protein [Pseudomassariella vexata]|uniref:Permease for cytosine/purines, uracil, thiamine, allantoin-domain-containing protein n=1 Tax=Pseudomassariella vexata TaxID=1141098 RepID=A0A1Y2DVM6_9PEZI|nr:permease for cytosine/purines, uracil, thiamine, allantoin-domain-containing protein [Pseudomassariella vexata]ORY63174.1 permease for cytosine/purines, uracil, thiamine, allantoin-domain-containing protein [Pseudomassariella vexata]